MADYKLGGYLLIWTLSCLFQTFQCENVIEEIKIGVLMRHRGLEEPLNKTLDMLNADTSVLLTTRLIAVVELIETDNSYQASAASK